MSDSAAVRDAMVNRQLASRGIRDERVLAAMRSVPREAFLPDGMAGCAYDDSALPIEEGQTISQPYIVALMAAAAAIAPGERALEIGTGSGYAAAVLARLAGRVYTVERHRSLAETAKRRLAGLGFDNIEVRHGDGTRGWPEAAPFDAIVVAAGADRVPDALLKQLVTGGRLVMPVGTPADDQRLIKFTRRGEDSWDEEDLGGVAFVPLVRDAPGSDRA